MNTLAMVLFFIGLFWVVPLTFYALFMFETGRMLKERIIGLSALFFLAAAVAKYLS